jgi:phosphate transport system substrate-binding protein
VNGSAEFALVPLSLKEEVASMKRVLLALSASASLLLTACGGTSTSPTSSGPTPPAASLTGAGATFPAPFYSAAFYAYKQQYNQVTVNYQSVGSGAGIQQLTAKTVDFGASDVPLKASEAEAMGGSDNVVQIATTLGTVSMAFNLPGAATGHLKLTPRTISGIFLGTIKKWNDPALTADNSGIGLPNQAITVVHRSDGSGTTYIFTDYLASVSPEWKNGPGTGKSVNWPVGQGAKGNEAVATTIKQTPGAIGYVELAYVLQTNMTQAAIRNRDGNFVIPTEAGATAAAKQFLAVTPTQFSIVNAPGKDSAPITGYSWLMLYKEQGNKTKGTALVDLLYWLVNDGQRYGTATHYAKLPSNIVQDDINALKSVSSGGTALLNVPASS